MVFAIPNNNTSISDLNVPRFVKRRNLAAQLDVQSVQGDWQFDDVGIFSLICSRFTATVELRFFLRLRHVMPSSARSHVCALVANNYKCGLRVIHNIFTQTWIHDHHRGVISDGEPRARRDTFKKGNLRPASR